jgi:hypothetical protein
MYITASLLDMVPGHLYAIQVPFHSPRCVFVTVAEK